MTEDLRIEIALANLNKSVADINKLASTSNTAFGNIDKSVDRTKGKFSDFSSEIPGLGRAFRLLSSPIALAGASIAGIGVVLTDSIRTFSRFEQQLSRTGSIVTAGRSAEFTAIAYEKLERAARELGSSSVFTAQQVAEAQQFLAQAGFNTGQILDSTEATLNLAASASIDLGKAADIASNVLSQFGKDASDLTEVVDILTKTTASANTNVSQLAEAFKFIGPTASALGVDLAEVSAAVGILGNSGIQGSLAGRALGTSLANLAAPAGRAKTEIERLGLTFFNARGEFVGLAGVVEELEGALDGVTDKQRVATLSNVFGAEALQEISTLYNEGSESIRAYTEELERAAGVAAEVAEKRLDNLAGSLTKLNSVWQELQTTIGENSGAIRAGAETLTNYLAVINQSISGSRSFMDFIQDIGVVLSSGPVNRLTEQLVEQQQILRRGFQGLSNEVSTFLEAFQISPELVTLTELEEITRRADIAAKSAAISYNEYQQILARVNSATLIYNQAQQELAKQQEQQRISALGAANSINVLQDRLSRINKQINEVNPNDTVFYTLIAQSKEVQRQIDAIQNRIKGISSDSIQGLRNQLTAINQQINTANPNAPFFTSLVLQAKNLETKIDDINTKIAILKLGLQDININDISVPEIPVELNTPSITEQIADLALPPIDLSVRLKALGDNTFQADGLRRIFAQIKEGFDEAEISGAQLKDSLQNLGVAVRSTLGSVAINTFEKFGQAAGLALRGISSASDSLTAAFQSLIQGLLVEVPKLIGVGLIKLGVSRIPSPDAIPLLLGGAALVGLSGIAGGLPSGNSPITSPLASGGLSSLQTPIIGGLGSQAQAQPILNVQITTYLESDGIVREVINEIDRTETNINGG